MNKKKNITLYLNILIIILELIGLFITLKTAHKIEIKYYTECSNIMMLITSFLLTCYLLKKKTIPKWLNILTHMSVLGLTVTFLVVLFILSPMYNFNYGLLLFRGSMLYFHTLCPIISIITYFFSSQIHIAKKEIKYTMLFTIIYSTVILLLNIFRILEGPYPFLMVYKQPIYMSIIWIILLEGGAYLLSIVLYKIKKRINS